MKAQIELGIGDIIKTLDFSGAVLVKSGGETLYESTGGYANRSEKRNNTLLTRFGIASGCKLFTAVGIAMLVESGKLTFQTKLKDCLDINFPNFDEKITIHHLLTHSSGIADYFDEEVMDDFEELWEELPMYKMNNLSTFLPLFQDQTMMFSPGARFHYNNAGYIVLGLIIEQATGMTFTDYIETQIFKKIGMNSSGYFSLDQLPKNTATGYIDGQDGWKTNVYSIPIKGGADGGAFVTAPDMITFWEALLSYQLLTEDTTTLLLTPHIESDEDEYYGYGVWIDRRGDEILKYHIMGYDPGVSFHSAFYPESGVKLVIPSNKSEGAYDVMLEIEKYIM
ncbi:serine hydrolase domain-containing protein [Oceanobacillus bengalensis]|uniref:Class C beta-lactamase-related serine hydrolase n=1 Tax=Oceanobacillus bengalensis TaxID=1435466 RepID=A0A494Z2W5_9BACI|nr:serine hydrolase [Oceanobacillus bengalensis]RKQ16860.1 class C beta-lactamase-related serine hydrolase [Oceanobacillus bengalensis]